MGVGVGGQVVLEWKWEEVWSAWWWGRVLVLVWGLVEVVVGWWCW